MAPGNQAPSAAVEAEPPRRRTYARKSAAPIAADAASPAAVAEKAATAAPPPLPRLFADLTRGSVNESRLLSYQDSDDDMEDAEKARDTEARELLRIPKVFYNSEDDGSSAGENDDDNNDEEDEEALLNRIRALKSKSSQSASPNYHSKPLPARESPIDTGDVQSPQPEKSSEPEEMEHDEDGVRDDNNENDNAGVDEDDEDSIFVTSRSRRAALSRSSQIPESRDSLSAAAVASHDLDKDLEEDDNVFGKDDSDEEQDEAVDAAEAPQGTLAGITTTNEYEDALLASDDEAALRSKATKFKKVSKPNDAILIYFRD